MLLPYALLFALSLVPQEADQARELALPDLELEDLDAWRAHVRPRADEVAFEGLPWIPEFAAGVRAASQAGKPLLFWAMNGHPLGCT